jgi:hypothetical protein
MFSFHHAWKHRLLVCLQKRGWTTSVTAACQTGNDLSTSDQSEPDMPRGDPLRSSGSWKTMGAKRHGKRLASHSEESASIGQKPTADTAGWTVSPGGAGSARYRVPSGRNHRTVPS